MDQQVIENYEKQRYKAVFGQTVSFAIWFGALVAAFCMKDAGWSPLWAQIVVSVLVVTGVVPFVGYVFKLTKITKLIVCDPEIRGAVNNEMYIANDRKAGVWGYYMTLLASVIMFAVANSTSVSAVTATAAVLYVAALSAKVAQLVVHR